MKAKVIIFVCALFALLSISAEAEAQKVSIGGIVTEKQTGEPVEFAAVLIEGTNQWSVTDSKGQFVIKNIPQGQQTIVFSCLGYVDQKMEVTLTKDQLALKIKMDLDNLTLEGAVITAKEDNGTTTTRTINKTAIEQVQMMNIADLSSLLPGGATVNPNLLSEQTFDLRTVKGESGSSSFGTAVEVDGVRISSNSMMGAADGTSTALKGAMVNNIGTTNVESIEVITGVPSVEYGDMTNGVVKINTKKGKTPWMITLSTNPKTKQASFSKGFGLGNTKSGASGGVINASAEYTRSYQDRMSPYTSYDRKQLALTYSNLFASGALYDTPLRLTVGVTGNLGGYDNKADPDRIAETFERVNDNAIRGNLQLSWLLNKSWITNIELNGSVSYNDKLSRTNSYYSSSSTTVALHGTEKGYFMSEPYEDGKNQAAIMINPGMWYNTMVVDQKLFNSKLGLKADWSHKFGEVSNKLKIGVDWTVDKNFGVGQYSENQATAPTYRPYRYCDLPAMNNVAAYLEENVMIPVGQEGRINLVAGLRNDNTIIQGSAYGTTSSLSPRFNAKYTILTDKYHRNEFVKNLSVRAAWGEAVKLPSYSILYPEPSYYDLPVFTSTASGNNTVYRAYYIMPRTIEYNSGLKWQKSQQTEIGVDFNLGGTAISLVGYYTKTKDSYRLLSNYESFNYNETYLSSFVDCGIPAGDRIYTIDQSSGYVTALDKNGVKTPYTAEAVNKTRYISSYTEDNDDTPSHRCGFEWVIDFTKIKAINTSIRFDGAYRYYGSIYTDMVQYCPSTTAGSDNKPFKYVGVFYGGDDNSNVSKRSSVKANITITTNIPKIRMIFSVKVEGSLYNYSQMLSYRADGSQRTYGLRDKTDLTSRDASIDFHNEDAYTATYPDYYYSYDDPTPRDFWTDFVNAKTSGDTKKYNDLSKLVTVSGTYTYMYHPTRISPYFNVNFNVTKEIKDFASISFYANNFFNNTAELYDSRTGQYVSSTSYIPQFYYGLTLRLKF